MESNTTPALRSKLHKALTQVQEQLQNVQKLTEGQTLTNGEFRFTTNRESSGVQIQTEKRLAVLIAIYAFIKAEYNNYIAAAKELGLKEWPEFKWQSYTLEQWTNDIKIRVAVTSQSEQIGRLKAQENQLKQFLSTEDKLNIVLKELGIED